MRATSAKGWLPATAILLAAAGAGPEPGEGEKSKGRVYGMTVESVLKVKPAPGMTQKRSITTEIWARLDYRVDLKPGEVDVTLHADELRARQNGKLIQETRTNRAGFQERPKPGAPMVDVPYDQAPPTVQEHLRTYDTPVVSMTLDARGHEVSRKVLVEGQTAATQVGLAETILSVHAPFPLDAQRWQAPGRIALGMGRSAEGTLRFEKVGTDGDAVKVRVSGVLRVEGLLGLSKVKSGTYTVTGEQLYDPQTRAWRSARWSVAVALEVTTPDDLPLGLSSGTLLMVMGPPDVLVKSAGDADKAKAKARSAAAVEAKAKAKARADADARIGVGGPASKAKP